MVQARDQERTGRLIPATGARRVEICACRERTCAGPAHRRRARAGTDLPASRRLGMAGKKLPPHGHRDGPTGPRLRAEPRFAGTRAYPAGICDASPFLPRARWATEAVWTGQEMVLWGGVPDMDEGGLYDPLRDAWRPTEALGAPSPGTDTTVWTGTGGYGANVAVGAVDAAGRILTGPGPSAVFGPHVRAFRYDGTGVVAMAGVSFFAYQTLRYGVSVAGADLDTDLSHEMATGAGPGAVFGPHVRGFDYDGAGVGLLVGLSFYSYGTLRYGVEIRAADVDADGYAELLIGPGPSVVFSSQLRGFD